MYPKISLLLPQNLVWLQVGFEVTSLLSLKYTAFGLYTSNAGDTVSIPG